MKFQKIYHMCIKPLKNIVIRKLDRTMSFAADSLHPSFTFWSDFDQILEPSLARNVLHRCYVDLCYIFGTRNLQFIFLAFFLHFSVAGEMHLCDTNLFFSGWAQVWQATANKTYQGYRKFAGGNSEKIRNCWNLSLIFYVPFLYNFLLSLEKHVGISHCYDNGFGEPCL